MVNLAINGICGKMGKRILRLAQEDEGVKVVVGFEKEGHPQAGEKIGGIDVVSDYKFLNDCDCVIDFSMPAATVSMAEAAGKAAKAMVVGTTNLDTSQEEAIKQLSARAAVVYSPNMSIGVNLFFKILKSAAAVLKDYQAGIKEAHHIHKKDAPSGTAKKLARIINNFGFNIENSDIETKRKDEIIGDHEVIFENDLDSFRIIHHAKTRDIFARGAISAAKWISQRPAGLYSMEDVLFE